MLATRYIPIIIILTSLHIYSEDHISSPHNQENIFKIIEKLEKNNEIEIALLLLKEFNNHNSTSKLCFFIGKLLKQIKKYDEALLYLEKAYILDNENLDALIITVEIYRIKQNFAKATTILDSFIPSNPTLKAKMLFEKAAIAGSQGDHERALKCYLELLRLLPTNKSVLCNIGFTLRSLHRIEESITYYNKVLQDDPKNEVALLSLALAQLMMGDLYNGFRNYEIRRKVMKNASEAIFTKKPIWDGVASLQGKIIFIYAEQGMGDTLQFIRYAYALKKQGACIIIAVQKRLQKLIQEMCPYIDTVITLQDEAPYHDYYTPLMTLPALFRTSIGTIPSYETTYLYPNQHKIDHWKEKLKNDTNFKIGICFHGSGFMANPFATGPSTCNRSIPLKTLLSVLFNIEGTTLYSLQQLQGTDELSDDIKNKIIIFDAEFDKEPFMDTAAVIKNFDLIISIDTSVAHLAGALGAKTFILLPYHADWRWMINRSDSPWYKTVKLFRQKEHNNWASIFDDLIIAIKKEMIEQSSNKK